MTSFNEAKRKLYKLCTDMDVSVQADFRRYPMKVIVEYDTANQTEFRLTANGDLNMIPHWEDGVPAANHQKIQKAVLDLMLAHALEFFASVKLSGKVPDPEKEEFEIEGKTDDEEDEEDEE